MTALAEAPVLPAEQPLAARFGKGAATVVLWPFVAFGWLIGRGLLLTGVAAGRIWRVLAFMAETVAFGFRLGAGLPVASDEEEPAPGPAPVRPSKL